MRRNAVLIGILALLLSITAALWTAPSVANEPVTANAHTAALRPATPPKRAMLVPTARKKRRVSLAASTVTVTTAPAQPAYHRAVDQPTITESHKKLATAALSALPSGCRDHLKNFSVLYQGAKRRGLGGKTTIILDGSVPDAEFVALLAHECGHVIHGNLLGSATSGASTFKDGGDTFYSDSTAVTFWQISWTNATTRKAVAKDADFVSGYAKSDAFEDFAETLAAYTLQRDMLRERATDNAVIAAKLQWMETYLPLPEDPLGDGTAEWNGTVPWDITRLPYAMAATMTAAK